MSVKIRLQRHGRSKSPFYHVVVADSRAPRDGKFIEKIGSYLPQTQPATIELDVERATYWLQNGAQPTDTCRAILSYRGAMMKNHLQKGVAKGVLTQEQADAKFEAWLNDKNNKVQAHMDRVKGAFSKEVEARLAVEAKANQARLDKLTAKAAADAAALVVVEEGESATESEEAPVTEEAPATEEAAPATEEAPAE